MWGERFRQRSGWLCRAFWMALACEFLNNLSLIYFPKDGYCRGAWVLLRMRRRAGWWKLGPNRSTLCSTLVSSLFELAGWPRYEISFSLNQTSATLKVRLGEYDVRATTEGLPHEDRAVSSIILHPEFDETTLSADIALLRLVSPVVQRAHIDVVCLPTQNRKIDISASCFLTGWGKTTESKWQLVAMTCSFERLSFFCHKSKVKFEE